VGWAVAAWLISHASSYGISNVRYLGYEWFATQGSGLWARQRAVSGGHSAASGPPAASGHSAASGPSAASVARAPAPPTTVVFG
jgi:hypothetical protein